MYHVYSLCERGIR